MTRLEQTGRTRHLLLLRDRLRQDSNLITTANNCNEFTKSEKEVCNKTTKAVIDYEPWNMTTRERELALKCVRLLQGRPPVPAQSPASPPDEGVPHDPPSVVSSLHSATLELCSPERALLEKSMLAWGGAGAGAGCAGALYVPDCEEIRVSAAVARRGYLNVLQHGTHGWKKRWVVVRRPYVFIYRDEKDPLERAVINLAAAHVEYSEDQAQMVRMPNTFSVVSKERGYLLQTLGDKDVYDWLYAINPLLAGQIRSRSARRGAPPPVAPAAPQP